MDTIWNPWHGCVRYSPGCAHCYVYRRDEAVGRDPAVPAPTSTFDLPVRRDAAGRYVLPSGSVVYTCLTSDFFLDLADPWRPPAWEMIRERDDLTFVIITKRVERAHACLPPDWESGWHNVRICATVECAEVAQARMRALLALPARHRSVICEPLLGRIDLSPYLGRQIESVTVGGESGPDARPCDYAWVLDLRRQCAEAGVAFRFKQTGARFVRDGRTYLVPRRLQLSQAAKAAIDLPSAHDPI